MDNLEKKFTISNIDPFGQGVHRHEGEIIFIPKTLPDETGTCSIVHQKKGVSFAKVKELKSKSPDRIEPVCPHFTECPSCQFLHTTYQNEINFKENTLKRIFNFAIHTIPSSGRLHYRNRIQLHYNLEQKLLGMFDAKSSNIIPIPSCSIFHPSIRERFNQLYQGDWIDIAQKKPQIEGHVELYWLNDQLKENWNKSYSDGEFTQVNQDMNQKLVAFVTKLANKHKPKNILELFAGNGNLSNFIENSIINRVDYYTRPMADSDTHLFIKQDLYKEDAVKLTRKKLTKDYRPDWIILDPPRSGLKNLHEWTKEFGPDFLLYVSCDPQTMARDLKSLDGHYQLIELVLVDLFPSTYHFETVGLLQRTALVTLPQPN